VAWATAGVALAGLVLVACSSSPGASSTTSTAAHGSSTSTSTTAPAGASTGPTGTSTSTPTTTVPAAGGLAVTPGEVDAIVAADTATNNRANGSLSIPLQDSHETCLQDAMDDINYRSQLAADQKTFGTAFAQNPKTPIVPRDPSYPASFGVIVSDVPAPVTGTPAQPTTTDFLQYVKSSPSGPWKLAFSTEILGPTFAGVAVPKLAADAGGYATVLDPTQADGLKVAPDEVAPEVAAAFTAQAISGQLPAGLTAQFGPNSPDGDVQIVTEPHTLAQYLHQIGTESVTYSATPPALVDLALAGPGCATPAYRLADGGALVAFSIYQHVTLTPSSSTGFVQPADRQQSPFTILPGGAYSEVNAVSGDMCLAIVPPAGSSDPIEVIGQAPEGIVETGVEGGEITT
jgi:hypothetical protein